jgi:hypothetical protein
VAGNGLSLTNGNNGVNFDLNRDGFKEKIAWTTAGSDDVWLCLDRNGNGQIDDGNELFGNYTSQPTSLQPNGFLALAEYDKSEKGGNHDGVIDNKDDIFHSLKVWRDSNHDGISDPGELHPLPSAKIHALSLSYHQYGERDAHGNELKYRAKILSQGNKDLGWWAYDVFLVPGT